MRQPKQFGHTSQFSDGKSQISYTDKNTAHVGVLIGRRLQEVYRVECVNTVPKRGVAYDEAHVSDMLDEGHWFAPTVEKRRTRRPKVAIAALARKYERLARKQLL